MIVAGANEIELLLVACYNFGVTRVSTRAADTLSYFTARRMRPELHTAK
jgi:hypothetical protein